MEIAIIQLGCLGDLILATSAISMIKDKYPTAIIDFIVSRKNHTIVKNNPNITQCLVYDKNPVRLISFFYKLIKKKYDYYIDPKDHYSAESSIIARLVRATTKIGFNPNPNIQKPFDVCINNEQENINLHFIERIQNALLPLNIASDSAPESIDPKQDFNQRIKFRPNIYLDFKACLQVKQYLETYQIRSFILINISAGSINRMWLPEKWIQLINYIKSQTKLEIILVSDKLHFWQAKQIVEQTGVRCFPPDSFQVVSALVASAALLITPDTSFVHIASTFDINQIVLTNNVPSNSTKFAPLSTFSKVIVPQNNKVYVPYIETNIVQNAVTYYLGEQASTT